MVKNKKVIAIIPARGGSKRIPRKNVKLMAGKPLISYTIEASLNSKYVDKTIVTTDNIEIADIARKCGADIIMRPSGLAKDNSSTEAAMIHAIEQLRGENYKPDYVALLQPTSPLRGADIVDKGISLLLESGADSLLSVCEIQHYYLSGSFDNDFYRLDYDTRPFSHTMPKKYRENGALYITKMDSFIQSGNRLSGTLKAIIMDEVKSIDIDTEEDFHLVEEIISSNRNYNFFNIEQINKIKLLIIDIDGVMTDGGMYYSASGEMLKKFNTRDAKGLELIRKKGIEVAIMTSEDAEIVIARARKLAITRCYTGVEDKKAFLDELTKEMGISLVNVAFIGDDINDLEAIKSVGFSASPCNAERIILEEVDFITKNSGGAGAVREVCNLIIESLSKESK